MMTKATLIEFCRTKRGVTLITVIGALLFLLSFQFPYWELYLKAPQYPDGLKVQVYMDHVTGDVSEVNLLNHYIGMPHLDSAAQFERRFAWYGLLLLMVVALLMIPAGKKAYKLFYLPPVLFLAAFTTDLFYWLYQAGHSLNPDAPVHIKPFTPILLGFGKIGQFQTTAWFSAGFWIAILATVVLFYAVGGKKPICARCPENKICSLVCRHPKNWIAMFVIMLLGTNALAADENLLQKMIDQAPEGRELRVPAGIYHGHFNISKPLKLTASHDAILDGDGSGTVLQIAAKNVSVLGFIIQNSGSVIGDGDSAVTAENSPGFALSNCVLRHTLFGLQLLASPDSLVEKNTISSFVDASLAKRGDAVKVWYSPGARIISNHISDGRDVLVWYSNNSLFEKNTVVRMRYGLHYMYSHDNVAKGNTFSSNSVGVYNMYGNGLHLTDNVIESNRGPSGYGVALKEADRVKMSGNHLAGNRVGLQLDNSPLSPPEKATDTTLIELNRFERNDIGVAFRGAGSGSVFLRNDFLDNWQQVSNSGIQKDATTWANNYWSDYRGVDPRGSGVGLIPYTADSLTDDITDRFESFKLFNFGPAMLALAFSQRLIPWVQANPKAVDHTPAINPHVLTKETTPSAQNRGVVLIFSVTLLGLVILIRRKLAL